MGCHAGDIGPHRAANTESAATGKSDAAVNEPLLEPFRRDPRGVASLRAMRLPETR
jgi:hypothetical protein